MLTFLFWNLHGKPLVDLVADAVEEHDADIVILAEWGRDKYQFVDAMNRTGHPGFLPAPILAKNLFIAARFDPDFCMPRHDSSRFSIHSWNLPARQEITVVATHLPGKMYWSDNDQMLECTHLAKTIRHWEERAGHTRTIMIGDFNMNPFEPGMVGAIGLNATMARRVAERGHRTVQAERYPFFYNPMWNLFGDAAGDTCGTYYYDSPGHVSYFWNVFDQVLLRPELLPFFHPGHARVLTEIKQTKLIKGDGRPDETTGSDHLPLIARLSL